MNCPHCKLMNPPEAEVCDCGYRFASGEMGESLLGEKELPLNAMYRTACFFAGILSWMGGLVIMVMCVVAASFAFNHYRRKYRVKAMDGFKFYGLGLVFWLIFTFVTVGVVGLVAGSATPQ